jgi:phospholipid transport system substrate-binding protein
MKFLQSASIRALWAGFALLVMGFFTVAMAEEEALAPPQLVIQHTAEQLQSSLQRLEYRSDFLKATVKVDEILNPHIDFDRVSILVLGKFWRTATPEQKAEFKKQFRTLLVRTYTTAFTEYSDWQIRYLPMDGSSADKKVMVKTQILRSGGHPIEVDYRMANSGSEWKVYDVLIEGISLLQNYRTSFGNEIEQTGSLDRLIADLADRNKHALQEPKDVGSRS